MTADADNPRQPERAAGLPDALAALVLLGGGNAVELAPRGRWRKPWASRANQARILPLR